MSDSLRGKFLIAATHLRDGNFYKAVVLMLEHNAEGAMGLVLNRPMDANVSEALSSHFQMPSSDDLLFNGGPVETNALLILHNSVDYDQEHEPIVPGVFVGTSPDVFDKVAASVGDPDDDFRFRIYGARGSSNRRWLGATGLRCRLSPTLCSGTIRMKSGKTFCGCSMSNTASCPDSHQLPISTDRAAQCRLRLNSSSSFFTRRGCD